MVDRRQFIKIGAGAVAGAAVASAVAVPFYTAQVADKDSKIASLQGQIDSATQRSAQLQNQLTSASQQVSTLQGQVTATSQQLTSANQQVSTLQGQVTTANQQNSQLQQQLSSTQSLLTQGTGFLSLNVKEQAVVEALAETLIPTDSATGPGAKEAGVIYFIDRQLWGTYGNSGNLYTQAAAAIFRLARRTDRAQLRLS